jgi:hypothetical protein
MLERRASDLDEAEKLDMFSGSTERSFHLVAKKMRAAQFIGRKTNYLFGKAGTKCANQILKVAQEPHNSFDLLTH